VRKIEALLRDIETLLIRLTSIVSLAWMLYEVVKHEIGR
jgi:hypothetical protein